jgi:uncharacterized protein YecE (DUF72 family)
MIRVGIGGWTYEPWRGLFFPEKLPKTKELFHASRRVTSIEVNGTFYGTFNPKTFRKWFEETPDQFVFSLKAPRFAVNRRILGEAGPSIIKFFESGVSELKSKLGPILWQLAATKQYSADDIAAFLSILPRSIDGLKLRHVIEPRHKSFMTREFITQVRQANIGIVTGYGPEALDTWTALARSLQRGDELEQFPLIAAKDGRRMARDVFVYFINGAKERAPAAAEAMLERLARSPD